MKLNAVENSIENHILLKYVSGQTDTDNDNSAVVYQKKAFGIRIVKK